MREKSGYVKCPNCGQRMPIGGMGRPLGRKPLNIDVTNIRDALKDCRDIALAAQRLRCSRAYVYRELKKRGTTPNEVLQEK